MKKWIAKLCLVTVVVSFLFAGYYLPGDNEPAGRGRGAGGTARRMDCQRIQH